MTLLEGCKPIHRERFGEGAAPAPARPTEGQYDLEEVRFRAVVREITAFFTCMQQRGRSGTCKLYDRYQDVARGADRHTLNIATFRDVLQEFIEEEMELTEYERFMLHQNAYLFAHVLHFLHATRTGHQLAGGRRQISGAQALLREYDEYCDGSAIAAAIQSSNSLNELVDPLVLLALIGAETDFRNFHNRREGVRGDFQFTSMRPPSGLHYEARPGDELSAMKRQYNVIVDLLGDIPDVAARKNIALCVAFLRTLEGMVRGAFNRDDVTDEGVRENFAFLMALTFYNSAIETRITDEGFLRDVREQPSSFITHLNFRGGRAGALYVPVLITYYIVLREYERTGSRILDAEGLMLRAFELCFNSNFGLDGSNPPLTRAEERAAATRTPAPTPGPQTPLPAPTPVPTSRPAPHRIPPPERHTVLPGTVEITVQPRLTKSHLVSTYFRSYDELYALNPHLRHQTLRARSSVRLPSRFAWVTVKQGDTAYGIARRSGTTVENLRALNRLVEWGKWAKGEIRLSVGDRVIVPHTPER